MLAFEISSGLNFRMNTITQPMGAALSVEAMKSRYWAARHKFRRLAWRLNAKNHLARRPDGIGGESREYQRFLILAHARSGSSLLVDALRNDPRTLSFGEIFHQTEVFITPLEATEALGYLRREMPLRFLKEAVYGGVDPRIHAVGFKVFPEHLEASVRMHEVREWLAAQTDISVINLTRRNLLRYYVSLKQARINRQWQVPVGKRDVLSPSITLHVDPLDAEQTFTLREAQDASSRALFSDHPILHLHYEDLMHEAQATFARAHEFLGLEPRAVTVNLQKQESRTLPEIIENYDELRRRWAGTQWESFLTD